MIPLDEEGEQSSGLLFFVVRGAGVSPRYVCHPTGTPAAINPRNRNGQCFMGQEQLSLSRSEAILAHWVTSIRTGGFRAGLSWYTNRAHQSFVKMTRKGKRFIARFFQFLEAFNLGRQQVSGASHLLAWCVDRFGSALGLTVFRCHVGFSVFSETELALFPSNSIDTVCSWPQCTQLAAPLPGLCIVPTACDHSNDYRRNSRSPFACRPKPFC